MIADLSEYFGRTLVPSTSSFWQSRIFCPRSGSGLDRNPQAANDLQFHGRSSVRNPDQAEPRQSQYAGFVLRRNPL
jgi:hypothetical protein